MSPRYERDDCDWPATERASYHLLTNLERQRVVVVGILSLDVEDHQDVGVTFAYVADDKVMPGMEVGGVKAGDNDANCVLDLHEVYSVVEGLSNLLYNTNVHRKQVFGDGRSCLTSH